MRFDDTVKLILEDNDLLRRFLESLQPVDPGWRMDPGTHPLAWRDNRHKILVMCDAPYRSTRHSQFWIFLDDEPKRTVYKTLDSDENLAEELRSWLSIPPEKIRLMMAMRET